MLFIHQYPDWTNFRISYLKIADLLCKIRFLQGKLQGKCAFALSNENFQGIQEKNLSNLCKIDEYSEIPKLFFSAERNFSNELTEKRLFSFHSSLIFNGGRYKNSSKSQNLDYLCGFRGVSADRIPKEMEKLIRFFNLSEMDPVLKAAIVHFWFVTIRPFSKGNGCMARLLSDLLLSQSEHSEKHSYSFHSLFFEDKNSYFQSLFQAQTSNGDITDWIFYFLSKLHLALENAQANWAQKFSAKKSEFSLSGIALSEREQLLIKYLQENPHAKISSSEWAKISAISHDSALRDFKNLQQKNILKKSKEKGRSTKYFFNEESF